MNMNFNEYYTLQPLVDARPQVGDEQYIGIQPYIDSAMAISRITYKLVYIIDYNRMNFLYVSETPLFLCGESAEAVRQGGCTFFYKHVPVEDLEFLSQIHKAGFEFLKAIAIEERTHYTLSCNFFVQDQVSNEKILINHQITPLKLDSMGNIWLALCLVSLAPNRERGVAYITETQTNAMWQFSLKNRRWKQCEGIALNEQEKKVIRLANQGLSVEEIANEINRSIDSVKFYRKSIFRKLCVCSISEAIAVATHYRLI